MHGDALEIVSSKKSFSIASLSNKLSKKLINMLSAQLSKKESNVASVLEKGCAMQSGFKEGYLRGKCKRKPCVNGLWCQEKMVAAIEALAIAAALAKPRALR